jgi:hypothetical protein
MFVIRNTIVYRKVLPFTILYTTLFINANNYVIRSKLRPFLVTSTSHVMDPGLVLDSVMYRGFCNKTRDWHKSAGQLVILP